MFVKTSTFERFQMACSVNPNRNPSKKEPNDDEAGYIDHQIINPRNVQDAVDAHSETVSRHVRQLLPWLRTKDKFVDMPDNPDWRVVEQTRWNGDISHNHQVLLSGRYSPQITLGYCGVDSIVGDEFRENRGYTSYRFVADRSKRQKRMVIKCRLLYPLTLEEREAVSNFGEAFEKAVNKKMEKVTTYGDEAKRTCLAFTNPANPYYMSVDVRFPLDNDFVPKDNILYAYKFPDKTNEGKSIKGEIVAQNYSRLLHAIVLPVVQLTAITFNTTSKKISPVWRLIRLEWYACSSFFMQLKKQVFSSITLSDEIKDNLDAYRETMNRSLGHDPNRPERNEENDEETENAFKSMLEVASPVKRLRGFNETVSGAKAGKKKKPSSS